MPTRAAGASPRACSSSHSTEHGRRAASALASPRSSRRPSCTRRSASSSNPTYSTKPGCPTCGWGSSSPEWRSSSVDRRSCAVCAIVYTAGEFGGCPPTGVARPGKVYASCGSAAGAFTFRPNATAVWQGDRMSQAAASATRAANAGTAHPAGAYWRDTLAPYARPHLGRSLLDLLSSVVPYLALSVAMYEALHVSYLLALLIAVPAAGFLVRTFILFHDCTHGSFLPSKRANIWLGRVLGLFVYSPFLRWRHDHAIHHATSGDLDRRGGGDVRTLTVTEHQALDPRARLGYRLFRNPIIMFGVGP